MTFKQVLTSAADKKQIADLYAAAVAAQSAYRAKYDSLIHLTSPGDISAAYKALIDEAKSPEELELYKGGLAASSGEAGRIVRNRVTTIIRKEFSTFKASLVPLLDAAEGVIKKAVKEAEEAERAFFAKFQLEREATGVSRRLSGLVQKLRDHRESITSNDPAQQGNVCPPKSALNHILDLFA